MALHIIAKFLFFILLPWLAFEETPMAAAQAITKHGCPDKCGNVSIPYPFGIGDGCFLDEWFEIICNDSSYPPKPVYGSFIVSNISILDGEITTEVYIATDCYDKQLSSYDSAASLGKFTFSNTKNKFIGIGCNTLAYLGLGINASISAGCMSVCNTTEDVTDGLCNGIGCCQASIPAGISKYSASVSVIDNTRRNLSFNSCSYAFLVEESSVKFSTTYLKDFKSNGTGTVPAVVQWTIGNETCDAVRDSASYACGPNTVCIPGINAPGYRCECKENYEGNAYLYTSAGGGCQDIDECQQSNKCGGANCINTLGSFMCVCPNGTNPEFSSKGILFCKPGKRGLPLGVVVSSGVGVSIFTILSLGMGYMLYKRFQKRKQIKLIKQNHFTRNGGLLLKQKITSNDGIVQKTVKIYVTEELEKMTEHFHSSTIIGKGGFGTVYKGMLSNGEIVAIKRSKLVDENQVEQFINEVVILSQVNHRYIVKLLGCCLETEVPLLVYEFVSNGTLSYHLHVEEGDNESLLSWKSRVRIASEIAGALAYLHTDASTPVFHRDIKSTNILLDENYKAKVSDFGISRSINIDKTHLTTLVQGTFGYLDPEYFHSSQFTDKSDVYSFGVILVELLTGEKAISLIRHEEEKSLAMYFIKSMQEDRLIEILNARVSNEGDKDDVMVVAELARRCLEHVGKKRPSMKEASLSLGLLHGKLSRDPLDC